MSHCIKVESAFPTLLLLLQGDPGDIGAPGRRGKEGDVVCTQYCYH